MKVLISGSSGFIGTALSRSLQLHETRVVRLVRAPAMPANDSVVWDPYEKSIDPSALEGVDAVIHLAGRNIGAGRWTASAKREIVESRTIPTRFLAETVAGLNSPPRVFISTSAVGYYGNRGDELLDESSSPGSDFLANLCVEWEKACEPARAAGIRTVNLRIGLVLAAGGGALPIMAIPFRLGVGGRTGSGKQYMSWITLDDLVSVFQRVISDDSLTGPVNAVSPHPVTNAEFTRALAGTLHRPAIFPAPAFALRLLLGEKADALLLSSARVIPQRLADAQFAFGDTNLNDALRRILAK